ncbi:MAG: hypothetical protein ACTSRP_02700 [Candidatus Helarchaeota archaeon]
MKYKFKIFGAPPGKDIIEIEVDEEDSILDIKNKILQILNSEKSPSEKNKYLNKNSSID